MKGDLSRIATGTVVKYECDPFFVSTTDVVVSECQNDGTWSSSIQCYPGMWLGTSESSMLNSQRLMILILLVLDDTCTIALRLG